MSGKAATASFLTALRRNEMQHKKRVKEETSSRRRSKDRRRNLCGCAEYQKQRHEPQCQPPQHLAPRARRRKARTAPHTIRHAPKDRRARCIASRSDAPRPPRRASRQEKPSRSRACEGSAAQQAVTGLSYPSSDSAKSAQKTASRTHRGGGCTGTATDEYQYLMTIRHKKRKSFHNCIHAWKDLPSVCLTA